MKKISELEFTWERWGGRSFGIDLVMSYDIKTNTYFLEKNIIPLGWIESKALHIRPRIRGISLLFQFKDEEEKYWIHCPKYGMEKILELKNGNKQNRIPNT